jgi:uncharacterized HAD superfamily protein
MEYLKDLLAQVRHQYLTDVNKISFDYDGTLTESSIQKKAKTLIAEGKIVYIITARQDSDMILVKALAKKLGISTQNVRNTSGKDKWQLVKQLGISIHYDNNQEQIDKINKNTDAKGILV